jgi:TPR repeat protein
MGNLLTLYQKVTGNGLLRNTQPGHFKHMPNFEKLVDLCTEDAKQSAIASGKWTDTWEAETKMTCRRMLSIYIVGRNIEKNYPELFELAAKEADD